VASAKTALEKTATMRGKDLFAAMAIDASATRLHIIAVSASGDRSGAPPRARWRTGSQCEKIYSIFEPIPTDQARQGAHSPLSSATRCSLPKAPKV